MLPAEPALDTEMSVCDRMVGRRRHLHDAVVLGVQLQVATHAAEPTHSGGYLLCALVPGPLLAHVVFGLEHQGAGRTHADAVPAVDARRVGQGDIELRRDVRIEAPAKVFGKLVAKLRTCENVRGLPNHTDE